MRKARSFLKECAVALIEIPDRFLKRHRIVFPEPCVLLQLLGSGDERPDLVDEVERNAPSTVVVLFQEERHVPALADSTPLRPEICFLCGSWVDAVFRSAEHVAVKIRFNSGSYNGIIQSVKLKSVLNSMFQFRITAKLHVPLHFTTKYRRKR